MFDPTISIGNLLQMLTMVGGGLWVFFQLRSDVRVVKHDLNNIRERQNILNEAFTQLGNILTKVAVQDERLNALAKDIDELRHGDGYVRSRSLVSNPH